MQTISYTVTELAIDGPGKVKVAVHTGDDVQRIWVGGEAPRGTNPIDLVFSVPLGTEPRIGDCYELALTRVVPIA